MFMAFLLSAVFTARVFLWALLIKSNSVLCVRSQRSGSLVLISVDECFYLHAFGLPSSFTH